MHVWSTGSKLTFVMGRGAKEAKQGEIDAIDEFLAMIYPGGLRGDRKRDMKRKQGDPPVDSKD